MRSIRMVWRLFKFTIFIYGIWKALLRGRWLAIGFAIWRILRKAPVWNVRKRAAITFVNAGEPAIYKRVGWRKIVPRRLA